MPSNFGWRGAARYMIALLIALLPQGFALAQQAAPTQQEAAAQQQKGQAAQASRADVQPGNNAPFWRDVRSGDIDPYQTTQVRGPETRVLIQSEGELWRRVRNGPITVYGGWLIVIAFLALGLFYWWKGTVRLHDPRTGRMVLRFTAWERIVHWTTAISFVILALSGIIMLFGRYVVLPLFGYTIFSALAIVGKNLHNFVGPLFVVCTLLMLVTFMRDNVPRAYDWVWVRKFGGLVSGEHVPAGRFNAGEKAWFWFGVLLLGIAVSISGLVLDFPNFRQTRETMQIANIVHATAAVIYMAISLGHIYLGTIGMEGAYDAMRHGTVDETWAKEHHEIWYREVVGNRGRSVPGSSVNAAPASPMKGWKA